MLRVTTTSLVGEGTQRGPLHPIALLALIKSNDLALLGSALFDPLLRFDVINKPSGDIVSGVPDCTVVLV